MKDEHPTSNAKVSIHEAAAIGRKLRADHASSGAAWSFEDWLTIRYEELRRRFERACARVTQLESTADEPPPARMSKTSATLDDVKEWLRETHADSISSGFADSWYGFTHAHIERLQSERDDWKHEAMQLRLAAERAPAEPSADLYTLLVRRGYAQHEADAIANGPLVQLSEPPTEWRSMDCAPRNGSAFLAYGIHDTENIRGMRTHWRVGDHWQAIILFDVWREVGMGGSEFVFSKDGARTWSTPRGWMPLPDLPAATKSAGTHPNCTPPCPACDPRREGPIS